MYSRLNLLDMALLKQALCEVVDGSIPKISSPLAAASCKAAEDLIAWIATDANSARAELFTTSVIGLLDNAFQQAVPVQSRAAREKMWAASHSIRVSEEFVSLWKVFLQGSGSNAKPILYQTVTDKLFEKRIQFHCCIAPHGPETEYDGNFTYEEESAVRYAAGCVLRATRKKILKSAHPKKNEMIEIIDELAQSSGIDDDLSCNWLSLVDRGGLIHISDDLYQVFVAVELEVRNFFRIEKAHELTPSNEGKILQSVLSNEDVLFFWCLVSSNFSDELSKAVLNYIVQLWITIRGFSFAKSYMEIYKQNTKKNLQRSKGLRKELLSNIA